MSFFVPVQFLNKYEVRVGGTKYLYKANTLYTLRDRESDADYDAEETWSFGAWCGVPATNEEHIRAFREAAAGRQKAEGDCLICMEPFNLSDHKAVTCAYCETAYCRTCIQTCLLQDAQPQCQEPACRKTWTDEFLRGTMTKTFMAGPYKAHREKVLLDLERARLPETQQDANRYKTSLEIVEPIDKTIKAFQAEMNALPSTLAFEELHKKSQNRWSDPVYKAMTMDQRHVYLADLWSQEKEAREVMNKDSLPIRKKIKALRTDAYNIATRYVTSFGKEVVGLGQLTHSEANKSQWIFTMRCPSTTCEGFVGMDWKCGMCNADVCKDCREITTGEHACDPDVAASVKALAKEAKPCPKCAAMISKIDGCDQMWCTQCKTAFSWRTGTVETVIHNPHYYQWMRQTGQHLAPVPQAQQLGVAQPGAECMAPETVFVNLFGYMSVVGNKEGADWLRQCLHILRVEMLNHRTQATGIEEDKRKLRVRRLVKDIDDAKWGKKLQSMERCTNKDQRIYQLFEMFTNTVADMLRPLVANRKTPLDPILAQIRSLADYVNNEFVKIKREFNTTLFFVTASGYSLRV